MRLRKTHIGAVTFLVALGAAPLVHAAPAAPGQARARTPAKALRKQTRLNLDAQRAPVAGLLQRIADAGGVNLVIADGVKGEVTLKAKGVTWLAALEAVAAAAGLSYRLEDNVLWVEAGAGAGNRSAKGSVGDCDEKGPLVTRLIPVRYADASEMAKVVSSTLSPRGSVTVDVRTNTLVVRDVECAP